MDRQIKVPSLEESIAFASLKHEGQLDKMRQPYILHPLRVMLMLLTFVERTVGVLHDVLEDTDTTEEELRDRGYPIVIVDAIISVIKIPGESYEDFVRRAAKNPIGMNVKKADILDNINPIRGYNMEPAKRDRLKNKYTKALEILRELELKVENN